MVEANCSTSVRTLPREIVLPPYLECGVCKTCPEIQAVVTEFTSSPFSCPTNDPNYQEYLARFLNYRLGMNLTSADYQSFLTKCNTPPGGACTGTLLLCPQEQSQSASLADDCVASLLAQADQQAEVAYRALLEEARANFISQYLSKCLTNLTSEQFYVTSNYQEYQRTLYYYDQSGQLVQTIPPQGVRTLSNLQIIDVQNHRKTGTGSPTYPNHEMATRYSYTSLNAEISRTSPDALVSRSWYDELGRLVASQDGRQSQWSPTSRFSYTLYDELGRVTETGEIQPTSGAATTFSNKTNPVAQADVDALLSGGTRTQVTRTFYDFNPLGSNHPDGVVQQNLRSRVAMTSIEATYDGTAGVSTYDYATHYDYDLTGDVKTVIQELTPLTLFGHRYKRLEYDYDQLSGKVNTLVYQRGKADQYSFKYSYDLDNRLTNVESSFIETDNKLRSFWDREASYFYYFHGPLARVELGHYRVQGMDYAYTLQGWIKGLNSAALVDSRDMGRDGNTTAGNPNQASARDVFAYTLGYYQSAQGDYYPIGGSTHTIEPTYSTGSFFQLFGLPQYTGNIRYIMQQNAAISGNTPYIHSYRYDLLMRIREMRTYAPTSTAINNWNITLSGAPLQDGFKENNIYYDLNGNLKTYSRWRDQGATQMDNFTYGYYPNTNKLAQVDDPVPAGTFTGDVDDQAANNYTYDGSGNLTGDAQSNISPGGISWSPYGKVLEVNRGGNVTRFEYDAMQNRVRKLQNGISTYYIRDAQGNTLAVYEQNGLNMTWREQYLYGSSRLGSIEPGVVWSGQPSAVPYFRSTGLLNLGWRRYEVSDHLGNVRTVINDRRTIFNPGTSTEYYTASILSGTDYFPFGSEMRSGVGLQAYRYGFNGKELDKNGEWGTLNHYDYGFRIYNPGLGRFLSVDPLTREYPWYSPFHFAGNNPIRYIDLDGLEPAEPGKNVGDTQRAVDQKSDSNYAGDWTWSGSGWDPSSTILERRSFENYPSTGLSTTPNRYQLNNPNEFSASPGLLDLALVRSTNERLFRSKRLTGSATSLSELLGLSLKGYDFVYLEGRLIDKIVSDPDMGRKRENITSEITMDPRYKKENFYISGQIQVGFGGDRGSFNPLKKSFYSKTLPVASNELTWVIRNAQVKYWAEMNTSGRMKIEYRLHDVLDLTPGDRSSGYNIITSATGTIYHDMLGGNRNLQTRAEWTEPSWLQSRRNRND